MENKHLSSVWKRLNKAAKILNDETKAEIYVTNGGELAEDNIPLYLGIDLGTADIVACVINGQGQAVALFLEWASVVRDGVVVDYMGAIDIVKRLKEKVEDKLGVKFTKASTSFPPQTDARLSTNIIEAAGLEVSHIADEPTCVAKLLEIKNGAVVDIGGGTTGSAIIKDKKVVFSADDPTGGHHLSLVLAGHLSLAYEKAELKKRKDKKGQYVSLFRPTLERMADIIKKHVDGYNIEALYLTGGTTAIKSIDKIFEQELNIPVITASQPLLLTPFAIANLARYEND